MARRTAAATPEPEAVDPTSIAVVRDVADDDKTEADAPAEEPTESEAPLEPSSWRYVGDVPRTYTNVPVTIDPGDVITWTGLPAGDGNWEPANEPATRLPDNHRPDPHAEAEADSDVNEENSRG